MNKKKHNSKHSVARGAVASVVAVSLAAMPVAGFATPQIVEGDQGLYIVNKADGSKSSVSLQGLNDHIADKPIGNKQALIDYVSGNQVLLQDLQQVNTAALDGDYSYLGAEINRIVSQAALSVSLHSEESKAAEVQEASSSVPESEDAVSPAAGADVAESDDASAVAPSDNPSSTGSVADSSTVEPGNQGATESTGSGETEVPAPPKPSVETPNTDASSTPVTSDPSSSDSAADPVPDSSVSSADSSEASSDGSSDGQSIPKMPPASSQSPNAADVVPHINATLPALSQQESVEVLEYLPSTIAVNMTTEKFISLIGEQARVIASENDLYASVMIAQAILESGSGSSALSLAPYNNLFGIKGFYKGKSVSMRTMEDDGEGNYYSIRADFRRYPTMEASLKDYADLLTNKMGGFYAPVHKTNASTYVDACDYLQGHYATSTTYSKKLQLIIEAYGLTSYDEALPYVTVDSYEVPSFDEITGEALIDEETGDQILESRNLTDLVSKSSDLLGASYSPDRRNVDAFNNTSLLTRIYKDALGVEISPLTLTACLSNDDVDMADLHMGDILFFEKEGDADTYDMAMYLSNNCFIEASEDEGLVTVTSFSEKAPLFAKRLIPVRDVDEAQAEAADDAVAEDSVANEPSASQEVLAGLYDELGIQL